MARWCVGLAALAVSGCFNGILLTPVHTGGPVREVPVADARGWCCRDKVALIDVEGMILNARGNSLLGGSDNPVSLFRERLDAAADDPRVRALVLRINSPGGGVTASDVMYQDLLHFRRKTKKPVVACLMDVAASGGFYLAMGCDHVIAHPTTVTGSIGVIMSLYDASGLCRLVGVASNPIKSGPNKDVGNPLRPMTDDERAILQGVVNGFYERFVQVVARGRGLTEEQVRAVADGRIYTGEEAKKLGLVDETGYLEDAVNTAMAMACVKDAAVVAYDSGCGYRANVYAGMPSIPSEIRLKLDVPGLSGPSGAAFLYLWEPGAPR